MQTAIDPVPGDLAVRPLSATDRTAWQTLWTAYLAFYETTLDNEMFDLAFARLLSDDDNEFSGLLALFDDKPVGLAHTLTHRHGWRREKVVFLQDLYVAPQARGRGIARNLINIVYARADAAGTPNVYWLTAKTNAPARNLYDRVARYRGFIRYER